MPIPFSPRSHNITSPGIHRVAAIRRKENEHESWFSEFLGEGPSYIAYRGIVYDVTRSFLWQNGKHQVVHNAGADLTEYLTEAPHGSEMLQKFPVVGMLV